MVQQSWTSGNVYDKDDGGELKGIRSDREGKKLTLGLHSPRKGFRDVLTESTLQ